MQSLKAYANLNKERLLELENQNVETGRIHDVVMSTSFLVALNVSNEEGPSRGLFIWKVVWPLPRNGNRLYCHLLR